MLVEYNNLGSLLSKSSLGQKVPAQPVVDCSLRERGKKSPSLTHTETQLGTDGSLCPTVVGLLLDKRAVCVVS